MLWSLGRLNTGVLTLHFVEATPKHRQRRDVAVWSGSENISEADGEAREHGRASRLHTRERGIYGQPRDQLTGLLREFVAPVVTIRISSKRKWYPYRGKPKGKRWTKAVLASS